MESKVKNGKEKNQEWKMENKSSAGIEYMSREQRKYSPYII